MDRGAWWAAVHGVTELDTTKWPSTFMAHSCLPVDAFILPALLTGSLLRYICASRVIFFSGIYSHKTLTLADPWYLRCQKGAFFYVYLVMGSKKQAPALCLFQCICSEKSSLREVVGTAGFHRITCPDATRSFHNGAGMFSRKFWWRRGWNW